MALVEGGEARAGPRLCRGGEGLGLSWKWGGGSVERPKGGGDPVGFVCRRDACDCVQTDRSWLLSVEGGSLGGAHVVVRTPVLGGPLNPDPLPPGAGGGRGQTAAGPVVSGWVKWAVRRQGNRVFSYHREAVGSGGPPICLASPARDREHLQTTWGSASEGPLPVGGGCVSETTILRTPGCHLGTCRFLPDG